MNKKELTKISKKMAHALRHEPEAYGLSLDKDGYVDLKLLIKALKIDEETLRNIVKDDDKQRYSIEKMKVRANQGHSTKQVDLSFEKMFYDELPDFLYHGTKEDICNLIKKDGLKPQSRQYVHLSVDEETAKQVAERRKGTNVIFQIDAKKLFSEEAIYLAENGVYLTKKVSPKYLKVHRVYS